MSHKQSKLERQIRRVLASQPPKVPPPSKGFLAKTWRVIAAGLTALGAVGVLGLIVLYPRTSMTSDASLDPSNPFATPFMLKNDGYESLQQIKFSCALRNMSNATGGSIHMDHFGVSRIGLYAKALAPDASDEIFCPNAFSSKSPIVSIDLNVFVSFTISHWYRPFATCFRFATAKDKDGHLRWLNKNFDGQCEFPESELTLMNSN
jgi:hypothetical protein